MIVGGGLEMIQRILVGVDGGDGSQRALRWASQRAVELDAEVVAVFVVRPLTEFLISIPPLPPETLPRLRETLEHEWCKPLREAGVRYQSLVVEGDPAQRLVESADHEHADMLVLGAQNAGGIT